MKIDLTNQVIMVTGASRGIGRAISEALGEAGATVAVHYNKNKEAATELAETIGNDSAIFGADLSDPQAAAALFAETVKRFDRVDCLVNNAGIAVYSPVDCEPLEWIEDWRQTMRVNLEACALLSQMAINHFKGGGGGRIINIASRAAFRGDTIDYMAYAASKGGMVSLTRSIARGFGKQNIKAFVIAPGFVRTDMAQEFFDEYGEQPVLDQIALPELTEPRDVAPLVVFLASGLADHATGASFDINAGSYVR